MNIDLEQTIRERAYDIWEREGRAHGRHEEHWHAAKFELTNAARDAEPIAVPLKAAAGVEKSRRKAAPVEPPAAVASPRRRRAPVRPAQ
jgi:hypothetical protein